MSTALDVSTLRRLTTEATIAYLGSAQGFDAELQPGCHRTLSGEPVADLNYLALGAGAGVDRRLERAIECCRARGLPFLVMIFPDAEPDVRTRVEATGLEFMIEFPFMVQEGDVAVSGDPSIQVHQARGADDMRASCHVLAQAFKMDEAAANRAFPPAMIESPGVAVFLASQNGAPIGTVTVTYHGDTAGIWAMGTDPDHQKRGTGRRLLSTVMAQTRERGVRRFYLGATAAGYPLYERLGFRTVFVAPVWGEGESGQV